MDNTFFENLAMIILFFGFPIFGAILFDAQDQNDKK